MKGLGVLMRVLGGMAAAVGLLLVAGCEISGSYEGDNTRVQFGTTNAATQVQAQ